MANLPYVDWLMNLRFVVITCAVYIHCVCSACLFTLLDRGKPAVCLCKFRLWFQNDQEAVGELVILFDLLCLLVPYDEFL